MGAIERSDPSPERIIFEVTELQDRARRPRRRLRIPEPPRRLRPDFVKLDVNLIQGVDRDPYKATIARKLFELAKDLGVSVLAEGIKA